MKLSDHRESGDPAMELTSPLASGETPSTGPGYYLAGWFTGEPETPGAIINAGPMPYLRSPRGFDPQETVLCPPLEHSSGCPMTDWLNSPNNTVVYRVEPVGVPTVRQIGRRCDAQQWTVRGVLRPESLLGPQAAALYAVHRDLYRLYFARHRDDEHRVLLERYEHQEDEESSAHERRLSTAQDAAGIALSRAGSIVAAYKGRCQLDMELLAVAAFDLIDTVDGWDRAAYDLIMGRYVSTFGDPIA